MITTYGSYGMNRAPHLLTSTSTENTGCTLVASMLRSTSDSTRESTRAQGMALKCGPILRPGNVAIAPAQNRVRRV
ncbi:hypothetical protein [Klugiella xanthotipulae]|uniref:Uncharacterized protein n=1 Tax=Klugiella xanthotipulae TaxID=244735 RepID=A0A543I623_9MICO|nr:hypothetical protein [Klugiella xanthotipulae]TQM66045.1 hypothetical protein FB466_0866 [Klugiella xanthotipulae]